VNLRKDPYHSQTMSADAHLALALGDMPFELNGNAIPPQLFHGEYGNGRGMMFVQDITASGSSTSVSSSTSSSAGSDLKGGTSSTGEAQPQETNSRKKNLWSFLQSYIYTKKGTGTGRSTAPSHTRGKHDGEQTNANAKSNANATSSKAALHHLEMAAELGNAEAQNILANILASGILPFEDHPELRQSTHGDHDHGHQHGHGHGHSHGHGAALEVQADFAEGGQQLAKAILLWHMSAMDGNIEAAMTLGYRHSVSATSGSEPSKLITEESLGQFHASGFPLDDEHANSIIVGSNGNTKSTKNNNSNSNSNSNSNNGRRKKSQEKKIMHSPLASAHYGVLGTCETSLAYFEAAANAIMDELEASPLRGKVNPARDHHKLAEMHQRGTSSKLAHYNKPDELGEAIKYYKMLANHPQNPDINAAYKVANMYHYGLRGVKQDMKEALKYYEMASKLNSWEAAGQAGKFHLWGMGVEGEDRSLKKAHDYFRMGTPGGIQACKLRFQKKLNMKEQNVDADHWPFGGENTHLCDHPAVNGMGLLHLYGVPMMVSYCSGVSSARHVILRCICDILWNSCYLFTYFELQVATNLTMAIEYFDLAKNMGNMDAYFNLAMMKLGWMNAFYGTSFDYANRMKRNGPIHRVAPTKAEYLEAIELLKRADSMGHIQAKHRLAMLYSRGVNVNGVDVIPQSCPKALKLNREIAMGGTTISKRMRAAYKQYMAGDYEGSLRNYIAAAETGSVEAQVNAAFLFEQGFCLGMNLLNCMKASVRMWRAAARQGDEEACLRVGDFYYYGRLREDIAAHHVFDGFTQRHIDYSMAPLPWVRYILYPEDLMPKAKQFVISAVRWLLSKAGERENETLKRPQEEGFCSSDPSNNDQPTCANTLDMPTDVEKEQTDHFNIAAHYYRKAADDHGSARANFNLGFMHEWGLGLTQDFPLAKRFYDTAADTKSGEGELAVQIALACMNFHETLVKTKISIKKWYNEQTLPKSNQDSGTSRSIMIDGSRTTTRDIIVHHIFAGDTALILILALMLTCLIQNRLERRR